jgi:hypothetical protein
MFSKMKLWGSRKQPNRTSRRKCGLRFEPLESRQLLAVLVPNPIVSAGLVGNDLTISGSAPEIHVKITESGGVITVEGLTRDYLGTDGDVHTVQTDVNNSGTTSVTFTPASLRDLKIKLSGDDSILEVGDVSDPVLVGRDLVISMPASTTDANLAKAGIAGNSYLCIDVDSVTVGRNMTITTGAGSTSESAIIDITNDTIGSSAQKGVLTIKTNGSVPNLVGLSTTTITGDASVTTAAGDDLVSVVGADLTGRLTISTGAGDNSVLVTDNFTEVIDSSLQTFVTNNPVFGDELDGELVNECVATLANDLNIAASLATTSVTAQNLNIYTLGGNDLIDVHDAIITGGNIVISAGAGTNVIAVTETTVATATNSSTVGNCTITSGAGDDLVILVSLDVSSRLYVNTGSGNDVILATPDIGSGVVDSALTDFVACHPGVFFDPSDPSSGGLDIENLRTEIRDIIDECGFMATKADFVTKDLDGENAVIDIALSNVLLDMTVTMGNGDDLLALSQMKVGHDATLKVGQGDNTIVVVGLGGRDADDTTCGAPTAEMNSFLVTTGNGDNTVVISLDWMGEPGYALGDYGIDAAFQGFIPPNPLTFLNAINTELDFAAQAMLDNSVNPYSVDAHKVQVTTGSGADRVTLSDIFISPSTTDRLYASLGAGDDILFFYDNNWDGFANLNGGADEDTLDLHRGGNTENNITVINFENVIPELFI